MIYFLVVVLVASTQPSLQLESMYVRITGNQVKHILIRHSISSASPVVHVIHLIPMSLKRLRINTILQQ